MNEFEPRFQLLKAEDICEPCGSCTGSLCDPSRVSEMRDYGGIRLTSDGFDCALPVTIDSHSKCSYSCAYCFSEQLDGHTAIADSPIGEVSIRKLENIFSGKGGGKFGERMRHALKYDRKNKGGYPAPIQLGGINDPGDNIERQRGWLKEFIPLAIKYNQPVRISTKGTVMSDPDYLELFAEAPHLFWITFSIISPDDKMMKKVDVGVPPPSERIKTMEALSKIGCKTALRFRPIFPGVSDSTPDYPRAYQTLIEMAAGAGASAVSAEVGFVPMGFDKRQQEKWDRMERAIGVPLKELYTKLGGGEVCLRPSASWTEEIMTAIRAVTHHHGMTLGVSDPCWKQFTDTGCCCGMLPDDPVFGNWERENATHALAEARDNPDNIIWQEDIVPPWAYECLKSELCHMGVGPKAVYKTRHETWADKLTKDWNNPKSMRGPLRYFQGALEVAEQREDGALGYRYKGLKETGAKGTPFWKVLPPDLKGEPKPPNKANPV